MTRVLFMLWLIFFLVWGLTSFVLVELFVKEVTVNVFGSVYLKNNNCLFLPAL